MTTSRGIFALVSERPSIVQNLLWGLFWLAAGAFYFWLVGQASMGFSRTARLALPLLGIAVATSWVLGSRLIPQYLLRRRFALFSLYASYTLVASVYLVLAIIVGEFMLSEFEVRSMNPAALDRPALLMGVYVVVATAVSIRLFEQWGFVHQAQNDLVIQIRSKESRLQEAEHELTEARNQLEARDALFSFQVDRKTVRLDPVEINYLESAADYVLVTTKSERLSTKARLSEMARELAPRGFLRVHRSFVVRIAAVDSFTSSSLLIGETSIPVGRTYRQEVRASLQAD